jgi:hypothetical protein
MMKTEPAEENIAEITDKRLTIGMDELQFSVYWMRCVITRSVEL